MRASQETVDLLTRYYDAMEARDVERYAAFFADDMTVTFANNPQMKGAESFLEALADMFSQVRSVHHDLVDVWEDDGGVVIFESLGTWTLKDGASVSVGACSVCRMVDGKFTDQHIYVDNGPLFAALEQTAIAQA